MKTIKTLMASTSCLAAAFIAAPELTGQYVHAVDQSASFIAQSKAQTVLNRAIESAGGIEALNKLRAATVTFSTKTARIGQGPKPDTAPTLGNAFKTIAYRSVGKLAIENFNGDNLGFRYVRGGGEDWAYLAGQNAVAVVDPQVGAGIIDRVTTTGHILLDLVDRSASMRVTKVTNQYDAIGYADSLGRFQTLFFDKKTGLLAKAETLNAHQQWGDSSTVTVFSDYKLANGAMLAHTFTTTQSGNLAQEVTIEAIDFEVIDTAIFEEPEGAGKNPPINAPSNAPRSLTAEALADNIYFIENAAQGYNVIFVNHDDGILVLETPQSAQASRDVIQTISEKFPGKKIKGAVPTHHHFDHSGGVYGYLKAGVPIITTAGNEEFVQSVGTASRNIGQNSGSAQNINVKTFTGKQTLGSGALEVQLINVGPNPHAEEIIVAYLPAIKSLLVADIFSARSENLPPANANQLAFAEKLEELKLDIETFIPVHGSRTSAEKFWDSVKRGRTQQ